MKLLRAIEKIAAVSRVDWVSIEACDVSKRIATELERARFAETRWEHNASGRELFVRLTDKGRGEIVSEEPSPAAVHEAVRELGTLRGDAEPAAGVESLREHDTEPAPSATCARRGCPNTRIVYRGCCSTTCRQMQDHADDTVEEILAWLREDEPYETEIAAAIQRRWGKR